MVLQILPVVGNLTNLSFCRKVTVIYRGYHNL